MSDNETILIIDDEPDYHEELKGFLKHEQYNVIDLYGPDEWESVSDRDIDLVFLDLRFHHDESRSFDLLKMICMQSSDIPVVMISNYGDIPKAIQAIKVGAFDFVEKGKCTKDEFLKIVRNAIEKRRLSKENIYLKRKIVGQRQWLNEKYPEIVGKSPKILEVLENIEIVAKSGVPVLICGETGTGKELVANAIHTNSLRAERPFVKRSILEIPREGNLLELEFFGRIHNYPNRGDRAMPGLFEKANHGSLLLDEIEGVPLEIQQRMLRPLQEKTIVRMGDPLEIPIAVDFRLITTTKRNLEQEVRNGHFREDLFYRINVFIISVPPLRERMEDIPLLACQFISREPEVDFISDNALDMLMKCSWAGNVRQLENVIKSASVKARYAKRNFINIDDLSDELIAEIPHSNNILPDIDPLDSPYSLEEEAILRALADIVIKNKQQLDISTNDIRKAMIPYLPQAEIFSGQRISAILRKLKLIGEDNTKHTESGNVYTIPLAKIKPLIQHYNINL